METSVKRVGLWTVIAVVLIAVVATLLAVVVDKPSAPKQLFPPGMFIWPYGEAAFRAAAAHNFNLYR